MVAIPDLISEASLTDVLSFLLSKSFSLLFIGASLLLITHVWTEYQTYQYFKLYSSEIPFSRRLVLALLALETFNAAVCVFAERHHESFNYPPIVPIDDWTENLFTPLTVVALFALQRVYARCVHLISLRFRIFVAIALLLLFTGLGLAFGAVLQGELTGMGVENVDWFLFSSFGATQLGGLVLTGVLIATMLWARTGTQCHSLVEILTVYALNAGLLTSMFALVALVFAVVRPEHLPILGIVMIGVKLITSARLAVKIHLYHLMVHPRRSGSTMQTGSRLASGFEKDGLAVRCSTRTNVPHASPRIPSRSDSISGSFAVAQIEERKNIPLIVV